MFTVERSTIFLLGVGFCMCLWAEIHRSVALVVQADHKIVITLSSVFFLCFRIHEVFNRNHAAPFSKVLTFYRKNPFQLEAFYTDPTTIPYPQPKIGTGLFSIRNFIFKN